MNTLWGFIKKELTALLRDPVMLVAVLIMPVVQMVVLSQAITLEAENLRLVIDAEPGDTVMERIYDHAIGSGWFVRAEDSTKDALHAVQTGDADVAIVAPKGGLTKALMRGESGLQILIDSTNVLKAQSIDAYLQGITMFVLQNEFHQMATPPIRFTVRLMFNPELNTQWFLVPAIMATLVFMSFLILISISITQEKENGTIETLISAPISKYDIILGKTLPYILVALINMFLIQGVGVLMFDLPFAGSFLMFMASFAVFCIPACAIAVWLSTYTQTQQQAMLGLMIVAFLALMLSGALFPKENMPLVLQWVADINPLTHFTYLIRNVVLKGADWGYFAAHAWVMAVTGVIIWIFAIKRFKTTL